MATQIRGKDGNFVPKTKLNVARHHIRTKKLLLPMVALVAVVGAVVVYVSNASSYVGCQQKSEQYQYSASCVLDSDEAAVVRLYYGVFNRQPDKNGVKYWSDRLTGINGVKKQSLEQIATSFIGSSEFKNKYGTLSNAAFVDAMYPQIFGRKPDANGRAYWIKKLDAKTTTRAKMITQFTQSNEMKTRYEFAVVAALGIDTQIKDEAPQAVPASSVSCYGTVVTEGDGSKWCQVLAKNALQTLDSYGYGYLGVMDVNLPAVSSSEWFDLGTNMKLVASNGINAENTIHGRGHQGNPADGSAYFLASNDYGYGGGMGGGYSSMAEVADKYEIYTTGLNLKGGAKDMATATIKKEELDKLPAGTKVAMRMDTIKYYKNYFTRLARPTDQLTEQLLAPVSSSWIGYYISVQGKKSLFSARVPYVAANPAAGDVDWTQTNSAKTVGNGTLEVEGSTVLNTGTFNPYNLKFVVKVYDADTGVALPATNVKVYAQKMTDPYDYTTRKEVYVGGAGALLTLPSDNHAGDFIHIVTKQTTPTRLKYTVDVQGPANYKLFDSYYRANYLFEGTSI